MKKTICLSIVVLAALIMGACTATKQSVEETAVVESSFETTTESVQESVSVETSQVEVESVETTLEEVSEESTQAEEAKADSVTPKKKTKKEMSTANTANTANTAKSGAPVIDVMQSSQVAIQNPSDASKTKDASRGQGDMASAGQKEEGDNKQGVEVSSPSNPTENQGKDAAASSDVTYSVGDDGKGDNSQSSNKTVGELE